MRFDNSCLELLDGPVHSDRCLTKRSCSRSDSHPLRPLRPDQEQSELVRSSCRSIVSVVLDGLGV